MMSENRIKGPGYYPRRPDKVRSAGYMRAHVPEPATGRFFSFGRQRSGVDDAHRGIGDEVMFEARDRAHAEQLATSIGIRFDDGQWLRHPVDTLPTEAHASAYIHYLNGRIAHPAEEYSRMWLFGQVGDRHDPARGIGQVVMFEAATAFEAEARLMATGEQFGPTTWMHSPYHARRNSPDDHRSIHVSTYVHWSDGVIEPWVPLPPIRIMPSMTYSFTVTL